jgi:aryl-alcohol dehydrogenase-like predicted oxidoreductase
MEYMKISNLEKKVSSIVFGTAMPTILDAVPEILAGKSENCDGNKNRAFELLDKMFELGVNTFDCAAHYGEEVIGEWVHSRGIREKVVIITKGAHPNHWRNRVTEFDILSDIHNSLAKLKTDYIDIYFLHRDDPSVPVGTIVDILNKLHNEGKIRLFGGSNWTHKRISEANEYAKRKGLIPFTVSSPNFGIAEQADDPWGGGCISISGPENKEARQWYYENKIAVFAYSSLGRGFFSGKFKSNEMDKAKEILDQFALKGYYCMNNFKRLERIEKLAKEKNVSVSQLALSWIFNQPFKVAAIVSPQNIKHMEQNIMARNISLTEEEVKWLDLEID